MVQSANIFCSLLSFELFPILGAILKKCQVSNHLVDKNLPYLYLETKMYKKITKTLNFFRKQLYIRYIQTLFAKNVFCMFIYISDIYAKHYVYQFGIVCPYFRNVQIQIKVLFDGIISGFFLHIKFKHPVA